MYIFNYFSFIFTVTVNILHSECINVVLFLFISIITNTFSTLILRLHIFLNKKQSINNNINNNNNNNNSNK